MARRSNGYPPLYWRNREATRRGTIKILGVTFGLAAVCTANAIGRGKAPELAAFFGSLFLFCLFGCVMSMLDSRQARILPYFPKSDFQMPFGGETFLAGEALARHCLLLDEIARNAGVTPLSDFGFADDLSGEPLVWHKATEGLRTVNVLLAHERLQQPQNTKLIADLAKLQTRLNEADSHSARFCLLLRHGNSTSGHEMDIRQGYF